MKIQLFPIYEVKGIDPGRYLALNKNTPKEIIEKFRNAMKKLPPLNFNLLNILVFCDIVS